MWGFPENNSVEYTNNYVSDQGFFTFVPVKWKAF